MSENYQLCLKAYYPSSTINWLKVETVSTINWLKVETVSAFNWLKVETVSTFKHFHYKTQILFWATHVSIALTTPIHPQLYPQEGNLKVSIYLEPSVFRATNLKILNLSLTFWKVVIALHCKLWSPMFVTFNVGKTCLLLLGVVGWLNVTWEH